MCIRDRYKYAVLNGADPVTSYAVSYTDTISDWAMAGVAYCTASKLMTGCLLYTSRCV